MPVHHPDLPRAQALTIPLRIPAADWAPISVGAKTQLRTAGRHALMRSRLHLPDWPVLGYMFPRWSTSPKTMLLIVEDAWSEPLGSISPASLKAEGFSTVSEFRSYWRQRVKTGYRPDVTVQVAQLRVMTAEDYPAIGARLFEHLYGTWL